MLRSQLTANSLGTFRLVVQDYLQPTNLATGKLADPVGRGLIVAPFFWWMPATLACWTCGEQLQGRRAPKYCPTFTPAGHQGVLYHTPETQVEARLEDCLTNVWPKIHKIHSISLKASSALSEPGTETALH